MPLSRSNVLIVEDQTLIALDLEAAVEDANGHVIGPAATVAQALHLIRRETVHAAILDCNLPDGDISPVVTELVERDVPLVINTGVGLPLRLRHLDLPVFMKPTPSSRLVRELATRIALPPTARPPIEIGATA